jgi:hypothetical protein
LRLADTHQVGTSSKDFTGRDRLGDTSGAYADTHGRFQGNANTQGTALTGREGNIANNPVAQAQSRSGDATGPGTVAGTGTATGEEEGHEKKGFVQKVKDALT